MPTPMLERWFDIEVEAECLYQGIIAALASMLKLHSYARALILFHIEIEFECLSQCSNGALPPKLILNSYTRALLYWHLS